MWNPLSPGRVLFSLHLLLLLTVRNTLADTHIKLAEWNPGVYKQKFPYSTGLAYLYTSVDTVKSPVRRVKSSVHLVNDKPFVETIQAEALFCQFDSEGNYAKQSWIVAVDEINDCDLTFEPSRDGVNLRVADLVVVISEHVHIRKKCNANPARLYRQSNAKPILEEILGKKNELSKFLSRQYYLGLWNLCNWVGQVRLEHEQKQKQKQINILDDEQKQKQINDEQKQIDDEQEQIYLEFDYDILPSDNDILAYQSFNDRLRLLWETYVSDEENSLPSDFIARDHNQQSVDPGSQDAQESRVDVNACLTYLLHYFGNILPTSNSNPSSSTHSKRAPFYLDSTSEKFLQKVLQVQELPDTTNIPSHQSGDASTATAISNEDQTPTKDIRGSMTHSHASHLFLFTYYIKLLEDVKKPEPQQPVKPSKKLKGPQTSNPLAGKPSRVTKKKLPKVKANKKRESRQFSPDTKSSFTKDDEQNR